MAPACAEYELVVKGHLGPRLVAAIDGFDVVEEVADETLLRGWLPDQAALHARLDVLADLRIELVSVRRIDREG